jgi:hypothetical protein
MEGPIGVGIADEEVAVTLVAIATVSEPDKKVLMDEDEDDTEVELYAYSWSLLPAPQNSVPSHGHVNEQSAWLVAFTLPAPSVLPQQHSRPYSTPNIENPEQNEAQDSRVIESAAYVLLPNARPLVASVQQPWNDQLPMA